MQKSQFFRTTLCDVFPFIPRVRKRTHFDDISNGIRETTQFALLQKLWFQHTWPILESEVRSQEVLAAVLEPVLFLVKECSPEEYRGIVLPALRPVFSNPKSIQASVTLLEKLPVILEKSTEEDLDELVLPLLFHALDSKMAQIQVKKGTFF